MENVNNISRRNSIYIFKKDMTQKHILKLMLWSFSGKQKQKQWWWLWLWWQTSSSINDIYWYLKKKTNNKLRKSIKQKYRWNTNLNQIIIFILKIGSRYRIPYRINWCQIDVQKKLSNERILSIVSNVSNMMIFEIRSIFYFFPKKNHEPEKISIDLIDWFDLIFNGKKG